MSIPRGNQTRLHCPVSGCNVSVGRKADLTRHQEERHGEMRFCSQPGCTYEGTKRASRLKAHMEKKHPELTVDLHIPVEDPPVSQYSQNREQAQVTYTTQTGYSASSSQPGYQLPISPTYSTSSAASSSWSPTVYAPSVPVSDQSQYPAQDSTTWAVGYYPATTYQASLPSDPNSYAAYPPGTGDNTSAQDYVEEGWNEGPHYRYP